MPTATPYYGSAAGNGFPFCLEKVDIDGFDHWVTLGGFSSSDTGSPTSGEISASLQNAWRLYWMLYGVTGQYQLETSVTHTIDVASDLQEGGEFPKERRCTVGWRASKEFDDEITLLDARFIGIEYPIVRMFFEGDFIGYGVRSNVTSVISEDGRDIGLQYSAFQEAYVIIYLCSYGNEQGFSGVQTEGYAPTEINGIHFLSACAAGSKSILVTPPSVDPANRTGTGYRDIGGVETALTMTLDSIEFYNQ